MKNVFLFISTLSLGSSICLAQAQTSGRFDQQNFWKSIDLYRNQDLVIPALETDRGTYRINPRRDHSVTYFLSFGDKHISETEWKKTCTNYLSRDRFDKIEKIELSVTANPFAAEGDFKIKNKDNVGQSISRKNIENLPKITDVSLDYKRINIAIPDSYQHPLGHTQFVEDAKGELTKQFENQRSKFLKTGQVKFDLSDHPWRHIACDMAFGGTTIEFTLSLEAEPQKAYTSSWISSKGLDELYKELDTANSTEDLLQAGIILGKGLERAAPNSDVLKKNRSLKLFSSLFEKKKEGNGFLVKVLNSEQIYEKYLSLVEIDDSNIQSTKYEQLVMMDKLSFEREE